MCCDILQESKQPSLFVAFIHLLKGLGNGPNSAKYCYDFLSPCGARGLAALSLQKSGGMASWEHFFSSLMLYSASLKQVGTFVTFLGLLICTCTVGLLCLIALASNTAYLTNLICRLHSCTFLVGASQRGAST